MKCQQNKGMFPHSYLLVLCLIYYPITKTNIAVCANLSFSANTCFSLMYHYINYILLCKSNLLDFLDVQSLKSFDQ